MERRNEQANVRVHRHEWFAPRWRGSLAELIDASDTALDEMAKTASRQAQLTALDIEFANGDQEFKSTGSLREEMSGEVARSVTGFHFDAECDNGFSREWRIEKSGGQRDNFRAPWAY